MNLHISERGKRGGTIHVYGCSTVLHLQVANRYVSIISELFNCVFKHDPAEQCGVKGSGRCHHPSIVAIHESARYHH